MKKILILENNLVTLARLESIMSELDIKNRVFSFDNIEDAYQCAMEKIIDLFLIDIILDKNHSEDVSGLKFVESIRRIESYHFTPIICITSLENSKLYTYERLHCYCFIEKPFNKGQIKQSVEQCLKFPDGRRKTKTLFFRKEGIILALEREDMIYAESCNHIMHMYTRQGDVLEVPYITLEQLLEEVDSLDFIQCSRNTIINKKYIQNVDMQKQVIMLKDGLGRVEIGVMYRKHVRECLK